MAFRDHFSGHSDKYAKYRPHYPEKLYQFLLEHVKQRHLGWDCGTGSGQVAVALAPHFDKVIATDASANQIKHAVPHAKVEYKVCRAEQSGLPDHCANLITVGQAMHWFDFDAFYKEVRRVGKKDGLIAIWTYGLHQIDKKLDKIILRYYDEIVGSYWPPERRHIDAKYETVPFPFMPLAHPDFEIRLDWTLEELLGYLNTWSSTQRYIQQHGENPVEQIEPTLEKAWGKTDDKKTVRWPLYLKTGYL